MVYFPHQKGNQIKEEEMDRTYCTHGREQQCIQDLVGKHDAKTTWKTQAQTGGQYYNGLQIKRQRGRRFSLAHGVIIHLVTELGK